MKKNKTHKFIHRDPEATAPVEAKRDTEVSAPDKKDDLMPVKRDIKRTAYTILVFILIIIVIYFIQTKTQVLNPVLKLFGL